MSKKVFERDLEKIDLDAINTYSNNINSMPPTQTDNNEGVKL